MSRATPSADGGDPIAIEIDLKDPRLAAFLAWLVPGLGHAYQGRVGKAVLFFVCIVGTFVYGLYIGDGRVVYASTADVASRQFLERWQYICQVGVGLPALPALVQRARELRNRPELIHDKFMRPPRTLPGLTSTDSAGNVVQHPDELAKWNYDLAERFEIGTVFTVIAGLLNVLAIFDAHGGPLVIASQETKAKRRGDASDAEPEERP